MDLLLSRHGLCLFIFYLITREGITQTISSVRHGDWNAASTWSGGEVPTPANSDIISIDHDVLISAGSSVEHMQVRVGGSLTIAKGASFKLLTGSMQIQGSGTLWVYGDFTFSGGASMSGNTIANTRFFDGSQFRYASPTITDIPIATWDPESTILVNNISGNASITLASWVQVFGNFIYDCPAQGAFMDFNGRIRNVRGNLIIRNTNKNILRFARGHVLNLNVGKDLIIEGPSEVWFGETGENLLVNIGGSFRFRSTSTAASYLSLSGTILMEVGKDFEMDATYKLKCTSSSGKSAVINVKGNFTFIKGTIDALGSGIATVNFTGTERQLFTRNTGSLFDGNIHFVVDSLSTLDLGTSCLTNTNGGSLRVRGKLQTGSLHAGGVIQNNDSGNLWFTGPVDFERGAILELNGNGVQYLSQVFPDRDARVVINNNNGVHTLNELMLGSLTVRAGVLSHEANRLLINGHLTLETGAAISGAGEIFFDGDGQQLINANGNTLKNVAVSGMSTRVRLVSPLRMTGILRFAAEEGEIISDGYLTLASPSSTGENSGNIASLGPLQKITGEVTVERFIDPGRMYRYISSPVKNATVKEIQNYFPVTGTFADPSSGPGINSSNPSLFFYEELSAQWKNYPDTGFAKNNVLLPGRGYAAFMRSQSDPIIIRWKGLINTGQLDLNVTHLDSTSGWNLVGNPYPCPISWDNPGWTKINVSNSIAVRDNEIGTFHFWNGSVGSLSNGLIGVAQAFWVLTTGESPNLTITEDAKDLTEAPFYRKRSPDFIEISLSDGEHTDVAFVQIDPRSKEGFDKFDALKLANDNLDLALLSGHDRKLAISAVPSASCNFQVPLHMRNKREMWTGVIRISSSESMSGATYRLVNKRDGSVIENSGNGFLVTFISGQSDDWILDVRIAMPPEPAISLESYACETKPASVSITNVTAGVRYNLYHSFGDNESSLLDEDDRFLISHSMVQRSDSFFIHATNFCGASNRGFKLFYKPISAPKAEDVRHCGPGAVSLRAGGARKDQEYHWLDSLGAKIVSGSVFDPGEIVATTQFFVTVYDSISECLSERTSVYAHIDSKDTVHLVVRGDTLWATGSIGNLIWYLDDTVLNNSSPWYLPEREGEYKVVATSGSCVSTDSARISGGKNLEKQVLVFPNPATTQVSLGCIDDNHVILNDIINSNGISVFYLCNLDCTNTCCILDTRRLINGTYLLLIKSGDKHKTIRLSVAK